MDKQYIKLLNTLRFDNDIEDKRELLVLRDYYEQELKDVINVRYLVQPYIKCIRTDDITVLDDLKRKYYIEEPQINLEENERSILNRVSQDYKYLKDSLTLTRKKDELYCVYMRIHKETGHFYIGHSKNTPNTRKHTESYYVRNNIKIWTKTNNITLVHEFLRELILDNKEPVNHFVATNIYSVGTKDAAETLENYIILMISLNKIPDMKPEKMLNIQYRFNEKFFVYQDIRGNHFTYINNYPTYYRIKM